MNKSISINVETQTEDNDVLSLIFVNNNTIATEVSDIAGKILKNNPQLFERINAATKIKYLSIERIECHDRTTHNNSVYSKFRNSTRKIDKDLIFMSTNEQDSKKITRIKTKYGKVVDIDKDLLQYTENSPILDINNITLDDLFNSDEICDVERLPIFDNIGVSTFILTDRLNLDESLYEVGYRVRAGIEQEFNSYVEMIMRNMNESIYFLQNYHNSLQTPIGYDTRKNEFTEKFSDKIFSQLGIDYKNTDRINIGSERFLNSEFGQAGVNYYNALDLLEFGVDKKIYNSIMRSLLPTKKTNPDVILSTLNMFKDLYNRCKMEFFQSSSVAKKTNDSKLFNKLTSNNEVMSETKETFRIDRSELGYFIFSNEQKGLNKFSSNAYRTRYIFEQMKYYPEMSLGSEADFMTSEEKSDFASSRRNPSFVTPIGFNVGGDRLTLERGLANVDLAKLREFRVLKSSKYLRDSMSTNNGRERSGPWKNTLSGFNLSVGKKKDSILKRSTEQNIDPLIDSKFYLGDNSYFVTSDPQQPSINGLQIEKSNDLKVMQIVSDIVPRAFVEKENTSHSLKNLKLSNPNSAIRASIVAKNIDLNTIPPQVKATMVPSFQPEPNVDPLANYETGQILQETQLNIYVVKALVGFNKTSDGLLNVSSPIYMEVDEDILSSGQEMLAKSFDYEVPELGIMKDKSNSTIYNNLIYIRG